MWSREVAAMACLQLPLVPMKHAYVVSDSLREVRGLPNIRDHDAATYFRIQGESICMGGYEYNPILLDKVRSCLFMCLLFIYLMMGSQDSSVDVVIRLWAGFMGGFKSCQGQWSFLSPNCPVQRWDPPSLLFSEYGGFSPWVKQLGHEGEN